MNDNARLLNFVYQNAQMGVDSIRQLMGIVENKELKEHLKAQFQGYEEFQDTARRMLEENGFDEKEISAFSKISTYLMINMQLLTDKSTTHIGCDRRDQKSKRLRGRGTGNPQPDGEASEV